MTTPLWVLRASPGRGPRARPKSITMMSFRFRSIITLVSFRSRCTMTVLPLDLAARQCRLQHRNTAIGDLCVRDIQRVEASAPLQVRQAGVPDRGVAYLER